MPAGIHVDSHTPVYIILLYPILAYFTKDWKNALIGFTGHLLLYAIAYYLNFPNEYFVVWTFLDSASFYIPFMLFGLLHFEGVNKLYSLSLLSLLMFITSYAFQSGTPYLDILFWIYGSYSEEAYTINTYLNIYFLFSMLSVALLYFSSIKSTLNQESRDYFMRSIYISKTCKNWHFAIVHWVLRSALVCFILNISIEIGMVSNDEVNFVFFLRIISQTTYAFLIAHIYRNHLLSYCLHKNKDFYPSWIFWSMQLPFIHLPVWCYFMWMNRGEKYNTDLEQTDILDEQMMVQKEEIQSEGKKRFLASNKNIQMLAFDVVLLGIGYYTFFDGTYNLPFQSSGYLPSVWNVMGIAAFVWVMKEANILYQLFALKIILIIFTSYS